MAWRSEVTRVAW